MSSVVPKSRCRRIGRWLFRWARNALAVIGLVFIIYHLCFELTCMVSGSMQPTLCGDGGPDKDWVLFERVSYWYRKPRRWEVVQFYSKDHFMVAKRVAGLPGETLSLQDKWVKINGRLAERPASLEFLKYLDFGNVRKGRQVSCGNGYYVLGDDTADSMDSRFDGPVPAEEIRARAWLIVWPPSRIGFVNP